MRKPPVEAPARTSALAAKRVTQAGALGALRAGLELTCDRRT